MCWVQNFLTGLSSLKIRTNTNNPCWFYSARLISQVIRKSLGSDYMERKSLDLGQKNDTASISAQYLCTVKERVSQFIACLSNGNEI